MFSSHAQHVLALADERGAQLRAEAARERLRGPSPRRLAIAESLRRAADRLDPTFLTARPASRP